MYEDEVDLRRSCLHLNNSFTSACWSDHNLDPDDIRVNVLDPKTAHRPRQSMLIMPNIQIIMDAIRIYLYNILKISQSVTLYPVLT